MIFFFYSDIAGYSQKTHPPVDAPDTNSEVVFAPETVGMYFICSPYAQSIIFRHLDLYLYGLYDTKLRCKLCLCI